MGGHGGLNILPQKSWNVYGRDNRERVLRDEAKHQQELDAIKAKEQQGARSERHETLLAKARGIEPLLAPSEETSRSQHINFWIDDELNLKDEDIAEQAKKLAEARSRGDPSRQTTDARFDASFQLASGLQKAAGQAWYVQPSAASHHAGPADHMLEGNHLKSSVMLVDRKGGEAEGTDQKRHKNKSRKREKEKSHKEKRSKSSRGIRKKSEQLRQERLDREAVEKRRTVQALVGQSRR